MVELQNVIQQMQDINDRLNKAHRILFQFAREKAESERVYRMELATEILKLRAEGVQAVLIADLARGSVAHEKFERDFAEARFRSAIESIETLKTQMTVLQSILRYQTET